MKGRRVVKESGVDELRDKVEASRRKVQETCDSTCVSCNEMATTSSRRGAPVRLARSTSADSPVIFHPSCVSSSAGVPASFGGSAPAGPAFCGVVLSGVEGGASGAAVDDASGVSADRGCLFRSAARAALTARGKSQRSSHPRPCVALEYTLRARGCRLLQRRASSRRRVGPRGRVDRDFRADDAAPCRRIGCAHTRRDALGGRRSVAAGESARGEVEPTRRDNL